MITYFIFIIQWPTVPTKCKITVKHMSLFFSPVLSEWSDGSLCTGLSNQQPAAPALQFVCESVLQGWCRQAQWMEEALGELRGCLGPQLQRISLQARGRALGGFHIHVDLHAGTHSWTIGRFKQMPAYSMSCKPSEESVNIFIGHFLWEKICLEELCVSKDLNEALTEGLTALTRQEEVGITVKESL